MARYKHIDTSPRFFGGTSHLTAATSFGRVGCENYLTVDLRAWVGRYSISTFQLMPFTFFTVKDCGSFPGKCILNCIMIWSFKLIVTVSR